MREALCIEIGFGLERNKLEQSVRDYELGVRLCDYYTEMRV